MVPLLIRSDDAAPVPGFHSSVSGLMSKGDRVLMVKRGPSRAWAPDAWDVPGGHIEHGEGEHAALVREAREELGVRLRPSSFELAGRLIGPNYDCAFYRVREWSGAPYNAAPEEHSELAWLPTQDLARVKLADPNALPIILRAFA